MNRVQVVLSGFSMRLFCFVKAKTLCRYGCMHFLAALVSVLQLLRGGIWACMRYLCLCWILARGGVGDVGGDWVRGLGLGFTNPGGTWGKWDRCVFVAVVWVVLGGVGRWLGPGSGRVVWSGFLLIAVPGICIL